VAAIQSPGERRFVVADQHRRPALGDHPFHSIAGDQVAVHQVQHDLPNAPGAGDGVRIKVRGRESGGSFGWLIGAGNVALHQFSKTM